MTLATRLHNLVKVEETDDMKESKGRLWTNVDLAPNPPETRQWNTLSFFLFQVSLMSLGHHR
jgi:cytosine/uracil/thiamine/allantoin permease